MLEVNRKPPKVLPFIRVNLYQSNNQIYFDKVMFYPVGGFIDFVNMEGSLMLGNWVDFSDVEIHR
jgi:hypothetical protein